MKDNENGIDFSLVLASSVHDMKNSIGMLLASLESVIEDSPPTNEIQARRFSTLHYEASRINSELVQLLTIYRMQNDFLPVLIDEYYILDIFEDQIARNNVLMETKGVGMTLECDGDLNWYIDQDLVGSVVHNILVNCIRYTYSTIYMSAKVENELLCITIADDGKGYPDAMINRPITQIEDAEVSKGGTHLGLYFSDKIAGFHKQNNRNGYIELANGGDLGGGIFKMYLP